MTSPSSAINFTKAALLDLPTPAKGRRHTYRDSRARGLHLVVTDTGTKTFYFRRKTGGRSERLRIGAFPDVTIERARRKRDELAGEFAAGANPAAVRRIAEAAMTLDELFSEYRR